MTVSTVAAFGAVTTSLAFAQAAPDYSTMYAKVSGQTVKGTLGARCIPVPGGSDCNIETAPAYPLKTTGVLKVRQGDTISLLFAAPEGDVKYRFASVSGGKEHITNQGLAQLATKTKKRWKIVVPKNLKTSSTVVGVDASAPNAYASFEFAVKVSKAKKKK